MRAGLLRCLAVAAAAEVPGFFGPPPAAPTRAAADAAMRDLAGWQRHVMGFALGHAVANLRQGRADCLQVLHPPRHRHSFPSHVC